MRSAPGGEEFLHEAGWRVVVADHEKSWHLDARPGSVEWEILEEACSELDKLDKLLRGKLEASPACTAACSAVGKAGRSRRGGGGGRRGRSSRRPATCLLLPARSHPAPLARPPATQRGQGGDKKAEKQKELEKVRAAIEDDKREREVKMFQK